MRVMLTSSPVLEVSARHYQSSPMDNVIPSERIECATLPAVKDAIDAYVAKVKATGKAAAVSVFHDRRDSARKIRGFDAATTGTIKVNFPEIKGGETVTCG
jgi:predicted ATP-grasp superfamily ATP-dependent carboligase